MSTSIKMGIIFLTLKSGIDAVLIFPGDMPFIKSSIINSILKMYKDTSCQMAVPVYQGRRGHPVLFDKKIFPELLKLKGDMGARSISGKHCKDFFKVEVGEPGILIDIDCWEDYLVAEKMLKVNS